MDIYPPFGIHWVGPYEDISGISHINRNVAMAALKLGLRIRITSPFSPGSWSHLKSLLSLEKLELLRQAQNTGLQNGNFFAVHSYPPHYLHPSQIQQVAGQARVHIAYSLFETNKIPANWPASLNHQNIMEAWVPCKFKLESYKKGGVEPRKLKWVPHGVDLQEFTPDGPRLKLAESDVFTFLTIMDESPRKGPEILLKAYFEEFAQGENVL